MSLYTLDDFAADLATAVNTGATLPALDAGAAAMRRLLETDGALSRYVDVLRQGRGPWLLHQHAGLGFIVTLAAKAAGGASTPHHHGDAWSLYGILDGEETVHRYTRLDDGRTPERADVRREADHVLRPGDVEVEDAFAIHSESTASPSTIALIVRGRDLSQVTHEYFDLATGAVKSRLGNSAVPIPAA
ncbi:MAG: hypothetical protein EXR52_02205 [Dehalococcoidia bacterium]|nr:hypothetical protein [Dehalococcoidia bacterium]